MAELPVQVPMEELLENVRNPFVLFPELVWENILNKLESHADLWNLLEVYPQLTRVTNWTEVLFDQILPLIFKDLDKEEILACRETCKWWKKSVDNFLDNHPSQQPYDPSSFSTITGYRYCTPQFQDLAQTDVKGTQAVRQVRQDAQQLLERHSIPPIFVGKSVWFKMDKLYSEYEPNDFFDEMDQLLTPEIQLGAGIRYVEFTRGFNNVCYPEYQHKLQMWLKNLPNLKSLSISNIHPISVKIPDTEFAELLEQLATSSTFSFPDLPQLESLELTDSRPVESDSGEIQIPLANFNHALILKFAPQLRKLSIAINLWKDEYGSQLESLTELNLDVATGQGLDDSQAVTRSLFASLNAPNLEKVDIKIQNLHFLEEILEMIQNLPFKVLTIRTFSFDEDVVIFDIPKLPNVLALIIEAHLDFGGEHIPPPDILKCFQELEYLQIWNGMSFYEDENDDGEEEMEVNGTNAPSRKLTVEFEDSVDDDENGDIVVWKLFPKLKVFVQDGESFGREMYEMED